MSTLPLESSMSSQHQWEHRPMAHDTSLHSLIRQAEQEMHNPKSLSVSVSVSDDTWEVAGDLIQVRSALTGVLEAVAGMSHSSQAVLRAANIVANREESQDLGLSPGKYVQFTLSRLECEMADLASQCSGFECLQGLSSEPGTQGNVVFYRPACTNGHDKCHTVQPTKERPRILVMDDDDAVCEIAGQMLEFLGYDVAVALDGHQAEAMYRQALENGQPFAAVILDLTIPDGSGAAETVRRLEAMDPQVVALVSSGYFDDPAMLDYKDHGFSGAITKPFRMKILSGILKHALGNKT